MDAQAALKEISKMEADTTGQSVSSGREWQLTWFLELSSVLKRAASYILSFATHL